MNNTKAWIAPEFAQSYIERAGENDVITALENNLEEALIVFQIIPEDKGAFAYAEGKWTIKELIQHLIDCERIFAYRALCIGRGDQTPLPGFEQDDYIPTCGAADRELGDILNEFKIVRKANIIMFKAFPEEAWSFEGSASSATYNINGIGRVMVGHVRHHLRILERNYL